MSKFRWSILLLLLCAWSIVSAKEHRTEIHFEFRLNSHVVEPHFGNNALQLQKIVDLIRQFEENPTLTLRSVSFCGSASPEGTFEINRKLAQERLNALESKIRAVVDIPESIITRNYSYISWEFLRRDVETSVLPHRCEILEVLDMPIEEESNYPTKRIAKLRQIDEGRVWWQLYDLYFSHMRNAYAVITYDEPEVEHVPIVTPILTEAAKPIIVAEPQPQAPGGGDFDRRTSLKINTLGLGLAIANIGIEVDLSRHWSLSVPVYYSAINYFVPTIKFRTLATQPEVRYWLKENNTGFFAGAHFGAASFNLALNGTYRYQDHDGTNPILGGGISIGYRMPISKNERWNVEFALGVGGYSVYCDKFYNVKNGKLADSYRTTYWGIDNASISISYRFNLIKRDK